MKETVDKVTQDWTRFINKKCPKHENNAVSLAFIKMGVLSTEALVLKRQPPFIQCRVLIILHDSALLEDELRGFV